MLRTAFAVVAAAVALAALWIGAGPAAIAGAQGTTCTGYAPTPLSVVPSPLAPGSQVTVSGVALPNAAVAITLRRADGTTTPLAAGAASSTGAFSIKVTIPADLPAGTHELVATAPGCPVPFTVVVAVPPGPGVTTTTAATTTTGVTTTTAEVDSETTIPTPTTIRPSVQDAGSGVLGATETRAAPATSSAAPTGALAFTGGEIRPYIVIAIVVIAVGALLVGTSRRRTS